MTVSEGVADLHMHTTRSDGTSTVGERVSQAREKGLAAIAITDHDSVPDELDESVQRREGIEVITGAEIKADFSGTKIEILGYYIDPEDDGLEELLTEVRRYRRDRNIRLTENFVEETGIDVSYGAMRERANGQVGRPHFARLLVEKGMADSIPEAFETYLGEDGDVYVPSKRVDYTRVIDAIHEAGGVASLAHPGRVDTDGVDRMIREMSGYGLDGVEVWYPYGELSRKEYRSDVGVDAAAEIAEDCNLIRTGGSDCHGRGSDRYLIGDVRVPRADLRSLRPPRRDLSDTPGPED